MSAGYGIRPLRGVIETLATRLMLVDTGHYAERGVEAGYATLATPGVATPLLRRKRVSGYYAVGQPLPDIDYQ